SSRLLRGGGGAHREHDERDPARRRSSHHGAHCGRLAASMGIARKAVDAFLFVVGALFRLFFAAILSVLVTIGLFFFGDLPVDPVYAPIDERLARARLDDEAQVATELGFVLDRTVRIDSYEHELDLEVGAGEC